ncbi:putative Similar to lipoprotein YidQ of Escherichia coli [Xenorhabdus cabanillasii JM26]|uniref:Similar to lipoprotein YidQ of Escherichia coli n=2 Tax=Xenorhabdus cabanillasii TaxID=351673 RepID=W1IME9_9GAMM|nr:membrane protein [Xenorhabdus cabanillasii JM26]CDL78988.1 putative Similar to lipoprotein YidQ of Escherichia coli [Xenorhabdus cabanillasii JM26]
MMKNSKLLLLSATIFGWSLLIGCSSIMTHSGPHQGYYSGAQANINMLKDDKTGWFLKPLLAVDLPLSAFLDTLLLPYDYAFSNQDQTRKSPKLRIEKLGKSSTHTQQISEESMNDED